MDLTDSRVALMGLLAAALLDYVLGDPWGWPHPVRVMGALIELGMRPGLQLRSPLAQRLWGTGLALALVVGSGAGGALVLVLAQRVAPTLAWGLSVVLLASCFAGRSLRAAAEEVLEPLQQGELEQARRCLSRYVGRDTDGLSSAEILRAVLETVSENATDGVMGPLFYAGVGLLLGLGSLPLAIAYKAASTLDSMVGYRYPPYTHLGWASARLEDSLTWLPARAVVVTVALISGRPRRVLRLCWRDAKADPSPNAGWSECAYAAALGVRLGGWNRYRGQAQFKPYLGEDTALVTAETVRQALRLTRCGVLLWLALFGSLVLAQGGLPLRLS